MKMIPKLLTGPRSWMSVLLGLAGAACLQAQPLITSIVETGGDNEATDTITVQWSGVTWNATIAGEPVAGIAVGTPYTVPVFGEDVPCFVDRAHQYNGSTVDQPLPDYLAGGDYIMSGNDNRDNASYQLDVTVSDAVIVYLLIDNRLFDTVGSDPPNAAEGIDPSGWVSAMSWVGTEGYKPVMNGLNRNLDPSIPDEIGVDEGGDGTGPGGAINQWSSVYSKVIPAAGTFTLYQADNAGQNMYGAVVKRLPNSVNNPPEITKLSPTNNTLFYTAGGGLSFTATTISPNTIPTNNISLTLNGTDVSGNLTVGGSGTSRTVSYNGLQADTYYTARIIVADQAGRARTNTFAFDTFNPATSIAIEAEDYNYESGKFLATPTLGGYENFLGARGIDFNNNNYVTTSTLYRTGDYVGLAAAGDAARKSHTDMGATDYVVTTLQAGDWLNYTRSLSDNVYRVYLRASSAASQRVRLDLISGSATGASQTPVALGTFTQAPGSSLFTYAPLADAAGNPVTIRLSGSSTLRLTALAAAVDLQLNYLLLVPAGATASPAYLAMASPAPGAINVAPDAAIQLQLANGIGSIDDSSLVLKFNGTDVTSSLVKTPVTGGLSAVFDPPGLLALGSTQAVQFIFSPTGSPPITNQWTFSTLPALVTIPANFGSPVGSGQGSGFNFKIRKAPNTDSAGTAFTLANTTARANQHLADQIIDPETTEPYINEAAGPNNNGIGVTPVINFEQAGAAAGFIGGDTAFPYIDTSFTSDPNNITMEFTTYVELTAGIHRFGVRSDDGFQVTSGPSFAPAEATLVLGQFEGGRGDALPAGETTFEFGVEASGVYALRMIYYEGNGGARVELYSIDRQTFKRTLINDSSAGAVKAFTSRSTQIQVPTVSITSPVNGASYPTGPTNIVITANAAVTGSQIAKVEFFDGATNKIGEATSAPYSTTWNNLTGGRYSVWARATDARGLTKDSAKVNFKVALVVQVNFQDMSVMDPPEGYLPDYGFAYSDDYYFASYNYHYGWDLDNTANARNRNNAISPDERYDTFNHLQKPQPAGSLWEIELPNGRYNVFAAAGEASNYDSVYDLTAEGVTIVKGTPNSNLPWYEGMGAVTVSDGRLSIGNGPTSSNNKVAFVEIYKLPADLPKPVLNKPTLSGGMFTVTWSGGHLQEASNVTGQWTDVPGNPQGTYSVPVNQAARKFYRVATP